MRPEAIKGTRPDPRHPATRPAHLLFTRGDGRPIHRSGWSPIWRPAVKAAGLPSGYGLRDLRHYFATVLAYGGANVSPWYWPDAIDQTPDLYP